MWVLAVVGVLGCCRLPDFSVDRAREHEHEHTHRNHRCINMSVYTYMYIHLHPSICKDVYIDISL